MSQNRQLLLECWRWVMFDSYLLVFCVFYVKWMSHIWEFWTTQILILQFLVEVLFFFLSVNLDLELYMVWKFREQRFINCMISVSCFQKHPLKTCHFSKWYIWLCNKIFINLTVQFVTVSHFSFHCRLKNHLVQNQQNLYVKTKGSF